VPLPSFKTWRVPLSFHKSTNGSTVFGICRVEYPKLCSNNYLTTLDRRHRQKDPDILRLAIKNDYFQVQRPPNADSCIPRLPDRSCSVGSPRCLSDACPRGVWRGLDALHAGAHAAPASARVTPDRPRRAGCTAGGRPCGAVWGARLLEQGGPARRLALSSRIVHKAYILVLLNLRMKASSFLPRYMRQKRHKRRAVVIPAFKLIVLD
jgi:hypothetical protein